MKKYKYFVGIFVLSSLVMNAQSKEERAKIASESDHNANNILKIELEKQDTERRARLANFFIQNPLLPKKINFGEMGIREIIDVFPDGNPMYIETYNAGSAITSRATSLYDGGSLGLNIQGQGMIAGIWDGGSVRATHQEFMVGGASKVQIGTDYPAIANHATHVGGTIAAQGISSLSRGLAFNSSLISYDWTNDFSEMLTEASNGLLVSNHSYGPSLNNNNQLWLLGAYTSNTRQLDQLCFNNPYYLPVFAGGNERDDTSVPYITQIGNKAGYDMIAGSGIAKNIMTVAAVQQVLNYLGPSSVIMSSFSNWGPTDDGRIKPDISTKGVAVRSTTYTSDTSYGNMDGTSMAAPGITGVVLLLQQYYHQLYSNYMKAATVKGLILHTADEAGDYPGPDYQFGWGLVNAQNAAIAIRDKNSSGQSKTIIEELNLANNTTYSKTITSTSTNPLKISISWTDKEAPSSSVNSGAIDPSTKYLVNDLDVKVTKDDNTYYPWKLQGMAQYYGSATNNSTNNVDNFERVDINNPSGTYTITVSHKGTLVGNSQNFSLIVTADNLSTLSTQEVNNLQKNVSFYPNPAKDFIKINEKEQNLVISVYDISGKLVLSNKTADNVIDVRNLLKGNYLATYVTKNGSTKSFKFTKE